MKQVKQHRDFLQFLNLCTQQQCNALVSTATKDQVTAISCVCLNVLNGFFMLSEKDKKTLRRYRTRIHALASKKTTQRDKRDLLKGKFLKTLLKIILPGILSTLDGKRDDHDSQVKV